MKSCIALILLLAAMPAGAAMPVYKWFPSNEFYFAAPFAQNIRYSPNSNTAHADAWGL